MSQTKMNQNTMGVSVGYSAYGNTCYGYQYVTEAFLNGYLKSYLPNEQVYTTEMVNNGELAFLIDQHYVMLKRYHADGTTECSRPHYLCQMLVYDSDYRRTVLAPNYEKILAAMDPDLDEKQIRDQASVPVLHIKGVIPQEQGWNKELALRESLLLIELLLRFSQGKHIEIVHEGCRSKKDKITEEGLIKLLSYVFPERSISVNSAEAIADFSFRGAGFNELVEVAQIPNYLDKSRALKKIFGSLEKTVAFLENVDMEKLNDLGQLTQLAEQFCKNQELTYCGILKMTDLRNFNMNAVERQFRHMQDSKEAQALLLQELEQAIKDGVISWRKDLEYILGILTICFRYSTEELNSRPVKMPIYPIIPYDALAIMDWINKHGPDKKLLARSEETKAYRILSDYCVISFEDDLDNK